MLLEHNETFKKEIETFRAKAEKIQHQATKDKINDLVSKLIFEVKAVDKHHNDIIRGQGLPDRRTGRKGNLYLEIIPDIPNITDSRLIQKIQELKDEMS